MDREDAVCSGLPIILPVISPLYLRLAVDIQSISTAARVCPYVHTGVVVVPCAQNHYYCRLIPQYQVPGIIGRLAPD